MKKTLFYVAAICILASCKPTMADPSKGGETGGDAPVETTIALDRDGVANCYIIEKDGSYKFKSSNTLEAIDADAAALVWESVQGMISKLELDDKGYIHFEASSKAGNALICATKEGTIVWSWHIWHPKTPIAGLKADNGFTVMNMNLGAMSDAYKEGILDTYGLLYQWGRKDPFPGSPTVTGTTSTMPMIVYNINGEAVAIDHTSWSSTECNTIEYAIAHPTTVISNMAQYSATRDWLKAGDDSLWGTPDSSADGSKSVYDPCPSGWRVPSADAFKYATTSGGYSEDSSTFRVEGTFTNGWVLVLDPDKDVRSFFPATGRYDGQYAMLYGSIAGLWGNYWGSAPYPGMDNGMGYCVLSFQQKSMSPAAGASRADAFSVRCVAE